MTVQSTSVRISRAASARLAELARATGKSKIMVLDEALAAFEDRLFWAGMDRGYARHGDEIRADLVGTEASLRDGLDGFSP